MVEDLINTWNPDEHERLRRYRGDLPRREKLESVLDCRGWRWHQRYSVLIDRSIVAEEDST
jgi:hypothetical protein